MCGRNLGLACLLTAVLALAPSRALGQGAEFPRPDYELPLPLGHDRIDKGGLFVFGEFVDFKQKNPIKDQPLAFSGFQEFTGGTTGITGIPGAFLGNHTERLNANAVSGPGTFQPGFKLGIGWRFEDGSVVEINYMNLQKAVYNHTATFVPQNGQFGDNGANLFLFSPVFNFPQEFGGPPNKVGTLFPFNIPGNVFGIWNGASTESIEFDQRTSGGDIVYRVPIAEVECYRCYGLIGPRFFWIWERFKWRTVSTDANGNAASIDAAIYTNITSNRMYGAHIGLGQDWYLGHGFGFSLDAEGAVLMDIVKERAEYALGEKDLPPINKRSITAYETVPQIQARADLWWYPHEAIQLRLGYEFMGFFNVRSIQVPVDFNWGAVNPGYNNIFRYFNGFNAGIALIF